MKPLKFFNTLTRKKEPFQSIHEGKVGMYCCGPTVYWYAHIGNMRAFIFDDLLKRTLKYQEYKVRSVVNITDVGHLTSDEDEGEDKMVVAMRREGKSAYDIARFYEEAFLKNLVQLNIEPFDVYPRATEHIPEQIALIKKIEANGFTYKTSDGLYFDTSKLSAYGKLSGQRAEEKQAGIRVEVGEKKHPTDFALWKFSPKEVQREMEWESPWGIGFPGWHIECSAMSAKYLGVPFDIHTGGEDHIAVHHENEIAQTQAADGVLQANYWMHNSYLQVDGGKMSKSLGNLFTVEELEAKGFDPLSLRYFFLGAHYRSKQNFTLEALEASQKALHRLIDLVRGWDQPALEGIPYYEELFEQAVSDDLNIPQALAVVWEMVDSDFSSSAKAVSLLKFDEVLGLKLVDYIAKPLEITKEVQELLNQRQKAREEKDWEASDRVRDQIAELGYLVEDSADGQRIRGQGFSLHFFKKQDK
ncbi:MAG: Cysteine-tRNA ligase [Candidatus Uhrbacteria bacterium GW2011_GWE2_40_58]|nr:MAG: Cysteine-tRNA ligase [Candidatus Uhrbacteria bacterium GW2011_GWF2_40_263]KKR67314.1 MAG: Cysteine-tRNA ligase [Candidatus Uhrbacteria bacterium GW2011_GWE2_40_58]OGL92394.1 MAG: cysteine--tRNA ligase [Candidatus Uhrbacteria bacterium RIFOXYA2_FULL_40_9]OGL96985.1 MAG: cysteine--tRNA ligase [Candidatus Uhrbacteria bacterium RIFOXYB2_FULL_41_18]HBK34780.1 cysteine--tRNA ligase [Candidatus Uhrbacteria bacterium]